MANNPNLAIVDRFVSAVLAGDGDTLRELCDPAFELHEGSGLSFAGTYAGAQGFLGFLSLFGETLEIARLEPVRSYVTDDPDYVICEMELAATVRATGAAFASSLLERWRFRNGRVLEIKPHYFNAMPAAPWLPHVPESESMTQATASTAYRAKAPVALIIGCGGMGLSIARALGRRHPLLMVDIDAVRLERMVEELRLEGFAASGQACDITDPAQVAALGQVLREGPGVRALAHVAAVGKSIGSWRRMMEIDLFGAVNVAHAAGPFMVRGSAAIFISSLASYLPPADPQLDALLDDPLAPGFLDALEAYHGREPDFDWTYNYAKLGVNRLAERMACDWAGREARALSLSPGMIDSPMARAEGDTLPSHDGTEARVTRHDKAMEIPLRREGALPEITNVVDFLLSDGASFINGIDIVVDGGHRAVWRHNGIVSR